ncbi:MAG: hypothetical protein K6G06_06645, partial [Butyrivibrio sp.]|nr:hypothetical protein [Butyrivibrio sp.]
MKKNRRFISLFVCGLLTATAVTTSSISVNAAPKVNPYNTVQAELLFENQGVEKAAEIYNNQKITVLNSIEAGDFWKVNDVDFSNGLSRISIAARSEG